MELVYYFFKNVSIGCQVKSKMAEKFEMIEDNEYLQYGGENITGAIFCRNHIKKGRSFGFGYYQDLNDRVQTAIDITLFTTNFIKPYVRNSYNYKIDPYSTIKGRICQVGTEETRIGFALKQNISENIKLTLSSDFKAYSRNESKGHQFSIKLETNFE